MNMVDKVDTMLRDFYEDRFASITDFERHTVDSWHHHLIEECVEAYEELGFRKGTAPNAVKALLELSDVMFCVVAGSANRWEKNRDEIADILEAKYSRVDLLNQARWMVRTSCTAYKDGPLDTAKFMMGVTTGLGYNADALINAAKWKSALTASRFAGGDKRVTYNGKATTDDAALAIYLGDDVRHYGQDLTVQEMSRLLSKAIHRI